MSEDVLSRRALNRALLARQWLLRRERATVPAALEHLVGLQAQAPQPPYVGLWTRLDRFQAEELSTMLSERTAVRIPLMRSTIHLVTATDCLRLRPVFDRMLERELAGNRHGHAVGHAPATELRDAARAALAGSDGLTLKELGERMQERWPGVATDSLAMFARNHLPLVQVPPRGLWRRGGLPRLAHAEEWLGRPLATETAPEETILRYLAAFGPASVADAQWWSGLPRLREVLDRLRPRLRTFRSEGGTELFDLPDAPRPEAGTTAPVRLLPQFDNILLSHADRTRIMSDEHRARVIVGGIIYGTVLVHGFVDGEWRAESYGLKVTPFGRWSRTTTDAVQREGARVLAFLRPEKPGEVRIGPVE